MLPAADLPKDAAGESAARVDSPAASPKRTRIRAIRAIRKIQLMGGSWRAVSSFAMELN